MVDYIWLYYIFMNFYGWYILWIITRQNESSLVFPTSKFPEKGELHQPVLRHCDSTRLRLHEEVSVQLGFSSKLHQLSGGVCILLVIGQSNPKVTTLSNVLFFYLVVHLFVCLFIHSFTYLIIWSNYLYINLFIVYFYIWIQTYIPYIH